MLRLVPPPPESETTPARRPPPSEPERSLDDSEILAAVRSGDPHAATALYRRVRPCVERTALRLLGRRDSDHDDLVQTAIIEIVRSLSNFRGECSLDTWSTRITARTIFRELRNRTRNKRVFDFDAAPPEEDTSPMSAPSAEARSMLRRVWKHLEAIDHVKAWTVVLHDVAGFDLREIAQITEASVAAAQSRLVRGRAELHERIQNDIELADELNRRRQR